MFLRTARLSGTGGLAPAQLALYARTWFGPLAAALGIVLLAAVAAVVAVVIDPRRVRRGPVVTEECANLIGDGFNLSELPPLVVKGKSQPLRVFQVLRPGQIPKVVLPGDVISAVEEKGHFEPAGYAPAAPPPPVPAAAPEGE